MWWRPAPVCICYLFVAGIGAAVFHIQDELVFLRRDGLRFGNGLDRLIGAQADELDAVHRGAHEGIKRGRFKVSGRGEVGERAKLAGHLAQLVLVGHHFGVLVGHQVQLPRLAAQGGVDDDDLRLQQAYPHYNAGDQDERRPTGPFRRVTAAYFFSGLRFSEKIDAYGHRQI
jgi:hypothetical protein